VIAAYGYDALGRRIKKTVINGGVTGTVPNNAWTYLYDGARIVQESGSGGGQMGQYVWGQYIDELVQLKTRDDSGPQPLPAGNYYLLSDLLYRSVALTDYTGAVVEAYDTDAYGNTLLFSAHGTGGQWFANDATQAAWSACRYVFTGREYDAESRVYNYRARYYHMALGRWTQRDPIIHVAGPNLYQFLSGRPNTGSDPFGLFDDTFSIWGHDFTLRYTSGAGSKDCTPAQRAIIKEAIWHAINRANNVTIKLYNQILGLYNGNFAYPDATTAGAEQKYFSEPNNITSVNARRPAIDLTNIYATVHDIQEGIQREPVLNVNCDRCSVSAPCPTAYAFTEIESNRITFCNSFFNSTWEEQQQTLIHEMSHRYAGTKDYNTYYDRPTNSWYTSAGVALAGPPPLWGIMQFSSHADTIAWFIYDMDPNG
jgi:RHS repeat-associated protein